MKKYLQDFGYRFTERDDLNNKEFRFIDMEMQKDDEMSTLGNIRNLYVSVWEVSVNSLDINLLNTQIKTLYTSNLVLDYHALYPSLRLQSFNPEELIQVRELSNGEDYYLDNYTITSVAEENRTLLTITFTIRGD